MLAKLTSLERLGIIESCDSMRTFPLGIFPKLWFLNFRKCQNLESFSIEGVDKNLRDLYIEDCPNLVCFPQGGLPASNLNHFMINGCNNLKSFPERIHTLTALRGLVIYDLPNLVSFAECGLPPNLRDFSIDNCCERLRPSSVGEYWGLQGLFSLEEFSIGGRGSDDILERLFKEQLLPPNLHTLHINTLSSLKSLDINGLGHLTSLQQLHISGCDSLEFLPRLRHLTCFQQLHIYSCPSLEFLPEEGLPPSLSSLSISDCSALEKRYENKTG
ncbi:putative disease resistance protein At3g14460 [Prunus persica]|uniref:putative disease resistance protein At3g14460 n=1 Tax=Prunus persica TaxID=3760 RepID=UPI0009AB2FFA|nr:putative disease resistance protein At3g14460 [Prunus persica]